MDMKLNGLIHKRNELLVSGINMLRTHSALDKHTAITYDVRDEETFQTKIQPWIDLKNDCVLWHIEIENFMREFKIDFAIWCNLLYPTIAELVMGLGAGGPYTEGVIKRIEEHLKKDVDALRQVRVSDIQENADVGIEDVSNVIRAIFFKEGAESEARYSYVINGHFENVRTTKKGKKGWDILYKLASSNDKKYKAIDEGEAIYARDYFNSHKRCVLWSSKQLERKPILSIVNKIYLVPDPGITLMTLTQKSWKHKVNSAQK
jgi:hypothetical protein